MSKLELLTQADEAQAVGRPSPILTIAETAKLLGRSPKWVRTSPYAPAIVRLSPRKYGCLASTVAAIVASRTETDKAAP